MAGDLSYVNRDPAEAVEEWARLSPDERERVEDRVRAAVRVRDDFIEIPFPMLASTSERQIAQAVESYKREAAIVDPRLSHEVTCAFKATALSDLCDQLRSETGIQLSAGSSVADEKVTLFCEQMPLRDVMRQLSRPFGYTWLRSRREGGEYRYELVQDLKSQLLEEELRNRDRAEALLALDREMSRYRPYLGLSPDEALARAKTAPAAEKKLLETLASRGWGPVHMYFRLTPPELAALRSGQTLTFSQEPEPRYPPQAGELPLPADMARGVLECLRDVSLVRRDGSYDFARGSNGLTRFTADPSALPLMAIPEARAAVRLSLNQRGESELGRLTLDGSSRFSTGPQSAGGGLSAGPYAVGMSRAVLDPGNAVANASLAHDPTLQGKITVKPDGRRQGPDGKAAEAAPATVDTGTAGDRRPTTASRVTSADILEALHAATGRPIVADFYTRLYQPETVSVKNQALFAALNHLADAMRLRWAQDSTASPAASGVAGARPWLQFRSVSFYHDRLKEVPNRLLARWAAARRKQGELTLDDLVEISGLSDAQLDAAEMAEGARELWGLTEWDLARAREARRHWRFLALLTPAQRQEAMSPIGLAFTRLSLAQQQQFLAVAIDPQADSPTILQELSQAAFQVVYTHPGGYEWPGTGARVLLQFRPSPVRGRTRDEVLAGARRLDPRVEPAQIVPTELAVTVLYRCGAGPGAYVNVLRITPQGTTGYDGRPARGYP